MFTIDQKHEIGRLREDNKSYKEIADTIGSTKNKIKSYCTHNGLGGVRGTTYSLEEKEKDFIERFESNHPRFEYVSGYIGHDKPFTCRCRVCGQEQVKDAQCAKITYGYALMCEHCAKVARIERIKLEEERQRNKVRKENEYTETTCAVCGAIFTRQGNAQKYCSDKCRDKAAGIKQEITKVCKECGKEYATASGNQKYCGKKCLNKRKNRVNNLNKNKRMTLNGKADYSITLEKLIKRHKNTCHICGEKCSNNDYIISDDGYFIAGNLYPSIDHVLPISKGGRHVWSNVKLAHRQCNSMKSDKKIYQQRGGQLVFAV